MDSNSTESTTTSSPTPMSVVIPPPSIKVDPAISSPKKPPKDPPLFSFQLTNPVTYFKAWWKKLVGNEGIKLTLQIKPLTAVTLMLVFSGVGFGFGRLAIPEPLIQFIPLAAPPTPIPSPDPWRDTAFTGKVQVSGDRYFLVTTSAEAITLDVPDNINLKPLIGKRLMVAGRYNKDTKTMIVNGTSDVEILPAKAVPVPTLKPSPSPSPSPIP